MKSKSCANEPFDRSNLKCHWKQNASRGMKQELTMLKADESNESNDSDNSNDSNDSDNSNDTNDTNERHSRI